MLPESCLQLPLVKRRLYLHPFYVDINGLWGGADGGACRLPPLFISALSSADIAEVQPQLSCCDSAGGTRCHSSSFDPGSLSPWQSPPGPVAASPLNLPECSQDWALFNIPQRDAICSKSSHLPSP